MGLVRVYLEPKLSRLQKLIMKINGRVYVGHRIFPGWRGYLPFYAFRCPKHGLVEDYLHGHRGYLDCPKCFEEERIKLESMGKSAGS